MNCPNCHTPDRHRIIWGARNFGAIGVNLLWYLIQLALLFPFNPGLDLKRRCLSCGYIFHGPQKEMPDFDLCAECGYNLTGNITGRCSECGWRLPRRFRTYRRWADKKLRQGDRSQTGVPNDEQGPVKDNS